MLRQWTTSIREWCSLFYPVVHSFLSPAGCLAVGSGSRGHKQCPKAGVRTRPRAGVVVFRGIGGHRGGGHCLQADCRGGPDGGYGVCFPSGGADFCWICYSCPHPCFLHGPRQAPRTSNKRCSPISNGSFMSWSVGMRQGQRVHWLPVSALRRSRYTHFLSGIRGLTAGERPQVTARVDGVAYPTALIEGVCTGVRSDVNQ